MKTRYFALVMGILFILAGVGGFLPFITTPIAEDAPALTVNTSYGYLLGLYPINLIHNLVHFGLGILGLMAYSQYEQALRYTKGLAVLLIILTILGFVLPTGFGLMPLYGHDIWLHGLEGIIALYLGFFTHETVVASIKTA